MPDRDHLSIGEVLDLLQDDFPDITISKIRFLESQGLLAPERTPSGYRKFYGADMARLRWILAQQKDHFLPLKVIRERLDQDQPDFMAMADAAAGEVAEAEHVPDGTDSAAGEAGSGPEADEPGTGTGEQDLDAPRIFRSEPTGLSLSFQELCDAAGLRSPELKELERLGMIQSINFGDQVVYTESALEVALLAAKFKSHGVDSRHLRMYKVAAEREAGFYEQLLAPILKRRAPEDRAQAREVLEELADLGEQMRVAMLRLSLSDRFGA